MKTSLVLLTGASSFYQEAQIKFSSAGPCVNIAERPVKICLLERLAGQVVTWLLLPLTIAAVGEQAVSTLCPGQQLSAN